LCIFAAKTGFRFQVSGFRFLDGLVVKSGFQLDERGQAWEAPIMNATVIDDRRRLVMPPELPARSAVTVDQLDEDTWIVKRARSSGMRTAVLLPDVKQLPHDPEWEKIESRIAAQAGKNIPPFEA
jgi:hypothetical protein